MADSGGNHNDVSLPELVADGLNKIFRAAGVAAVQDLVERVGVQGNSGVGATHIPVGVHIPGGHLQLLIEFSGVDAHTPQKILVRLLILRPDVNPQLLRQFLYLF
jgi:hypothetical protein